MRRTRRWRIRAVSFERLSSARRRAAFKDGPFIPEEYALKNTLIAVLLAAFAATSAHAVSDCEAKAVSKDGKPLAGAAKTSFMKKCEADAGGAAGCEALAAEKKLAGAARTSFVTKCEKDGGKSASAASAGATQADDKKLAGAARSSFVKKCVSDAGG